MAENEKKIDINEEALSDEELSEVTGGKSVTITNSSRKLNAVRSCGNAKTAGLQNQQKTTNNNKLSNEHKDLDFNF